MVLKLQQTYFWHNMQHLAVEVIMECAQCKGFGIRRINALLSPIMRRYPFELLAGDYLKLPKGFGRKKNVSLYIDIHSQYVWVQSFNHDGTGASTVQTLWHICDEFTTPAEFMSDGGSHFDCEEVCAFAEKKNITLRTTAAYAPWVNGLIEGANKILLGRLRQLCAPDLGEDTSMEDIQWEDLPGDWPKHLTTAVCQMNDRVLPSMGYSPRELLLRLVIEDHRQTPVKVLPQTQEEDVIVHMAFADSMHADAFQNAVQHAAQRKMKFDAKVVEVTFWEGDLIQNYNNKLYNTFESSAKLLRRWSAPMRVCEKFNNSYTIETLEGLVLQGLTHARWLCRFIPRCNLDLARLQNEMMDGEQRNGLAPEQQVGLANEFAGDGEEDGQSEDGKDRTDEGSEEERDLPDARLLMLDESAATHQPEIRTRMRIPWRGVPAPGSPGEGGNCVRMH